MKKLTLTSHVHNDTLVLEKEFIDHYMTKANGEYVKVYLLLLRYLNESGEKLTVSRIADLLDHTEKDVIRALNYWKKQGLLEYETNEEKQPLTENTKKEEPSGQPDLTESRPDTSSCASVPNIQQYKSRKEFRELVFVTEQYLGKTLSASDIDRITYFYETLHMSADLIEYLIEYCVDNGHKSMHYIQTVALSWHERQITTVEQAKSGTLSYNKNCYSVLNAFGIKGRAPASSELTYIKKWNEEYGFSLDIILEACNRTVKAIHQPSFDYADSILRNWLEKGVHHMKDILAVDADYIKEKEKKKKTAPKTSGQNNRFNNFDSRSYDMNDLEKKLVQQ